MDLEGAKLMTEGFKESEGQPRIIQKACGFRKQCEEMTIFIQDDELIVGSASSRPRAGILNPESVWSIIDDELETISTRGYDPFYLSEEDKQAFKEEIKPYWQGRSLLEKWFAIMPEKLKKMIDAEYVYANKKFVRGFGETTPGWDYLLSRGLADIKEEAEEKLKNLSMANLGEMDQIFYYRATIIVIDGLIHLANRYADLAREQAEAESDPQRKEELYEIERVCRRVPELPPESFHEAVQFVTFYEYAIYMEHNASSYNLGRIDQYLYPYYKKDVEDENNISHEEAQELLDCMWIKIAEMSLFQDEKSAPFAAGYCTTINTTPGGIDKYGRDAVNDLSYQVLQATMNTRLAEPNVSVKYNMAKNPDSFLRKTSEAIKIGTGMPAFHNDDEGIKMMMNKGVPLDEAWDWNPCGCVETNLSGRMKQHTDYAEINLGGMVELVLTNGVDRKTGEQISIQTGDPTDFKTYKDFTNALKAQIDYAVELLAVACQALDQLTYQYRATPVLSLGFPDCMEKGVDYAKGGVKYNIGNGIVTVGVADIINSVSSVKKNIYEDETMTMEELLEALDNDFEGHEDIYKLCMDAPKYGNDEEYVDELVGPILTYVVDEVESYETMNGKITMGMLPVSGNTPMGLAVGALPSGRRAYTPLTDGIGATGGTDINGSTALLKSVANIPHSRFVQGTQLNMKLDPSLVKGNEGTRGLMDLLKTLCSLDVYHVQFNVVDKETLLAAQEKPEEYKDLLIRVAGYTAFFTELGKDIQDEIIGRTEYCCWNNIVV